MGRPSPKFWAVFGLVATQSILMILLKTSQTSGNYTFSPAAAICLVELCKLILAAADLARVTVAEPRFTNAGLVSSMWAHGTEHATPKLAISLMVLSVAYALNNQLQFVLLVYLAPGVIHLFKSATTLATAALRTTILRKHSSPQQWIALATQMLGISLVKLNACEQGIDGDPKGIVLMAGSVAITAACSVWNEALLKGDATPMPAQNMILYACGFLVNAASFIATAPLHSFFHNFGVWACFVVLAYASVGLAVTACYKFADAVLKTLSSGIATIVLLTYGALALGSGLELVQTIGAAVVLASTLAYSIAPVNAGSQQQLPSIIAATTPKESPAHHPRSANDKWSRVPPQHMNCPNKTVNITGIDVVPRQLAVPMGEKNPDLGQAVEQIAGQGKHDPSV